jgi:hypothetical protein
MLKRYPTTLIAQFQAKLIFGAESRIVAFLELSRNNKGV